MPPLPPVDKVLKVEISGQDGAGYPWANVLHYQYTGAAPDNGTCAEIAQAVNSLWHTNMAPACPAATSLTLAKVTDLTSPTSGSGEDATARVGSRAGAVVPSNAAFLMSYPGAGPRYRGGHPRQYLLVGVEADLADAAHWGITFLVFVEEAWSAFTAGISNLYEATSVNAQCAVSYYTTDYGPPKTRIRRVTPLQYVISSQVGNTEIASQRGRIGRRR